MEGRRYTAAVADQASTSATDVVIEEAAAATPDLVDSLGALVPQLSSSSPAPTAREVEEIATSPATVLFTARLGRGGPLVGSLTLVVFRIPTGLRAWIEDVVVDTSARGHGVGAALVGAALDRARGLGCRNVDLTSRPSRQEANRLYARLGFEARETNVYRFDLERPGEA
jgi:ribosomal protein S18 acetylase RimI-like enzyme